MYLTRNGYPLGQADYPPINVRMKPLMGFGAEVSNPMSTEQKVIVYSLGGLVIAGLAWLAYKEVKLQEQIVAKGGGEALMKYQLGKAAGTLATGLTRPDYRPNKRHKKSKKHKRGRR